MSADQTRAGETFAVPIGARRATAASRAPLVVLYDERCPLCRRLRAWLSGQATLAPIMYIAADSPEAHGRFPALDHARTTTVLTVVRADGAVYEGERAWLVAAWLLPRWQAIAEHLSTRSRLPFVRLGARAIDAVRVSLIDAPAVTPTGVGPYGATCEQCRITAPPSGPRPGNWPPPNAPRQRRK
jgi:predicted DCC family thiol-disulfide oxidoreductase YuxK